MARFILDENQRRTVLDLEKDVVTVGRSSDNEIPVLDPRASRRHCQVERHGVQHVLIDLGSQNGTRLNGQLVERAALKPGDEIGVGTARLFFEKAPSGDWTSSCSKFRASRTSGRFPSGASRRKPRSAPESSIT